MEAKPVPGFRRFLQSKLGRVALLLLAIGTVFGTYAYVATLLAIPVFLIVGLAIPIYAGLKRPRYIALAALVVLLVVAPLSTIVFSQEVLVPPGGASSPGVGPYESGGSILQNATIAPFSGSSSTQFTWSVTLYPKYLNASLNDTNWSNDSIELFVSTCPGATALNLSYCGGGYTLLTKTIRFTAPPTNGQVVTLPSLQVPSTGIWSWQMEVEFQNTSSASNPYTVELSGDPTYDGLEGPVVGGFGVVYGALILTVYEVELIYLGIPFYFILLLYMWFKSREARRKEALRRAARALSESASGPANPAPPPPGPAPVGAADGPAASELTCPSCGAIVYANEAKCWKCGSELASASSSNNDRPLSTGPAPKP